jgi:transcriptional regulator with XRE-family HTH domain
MEASVSIGERLRQVREEMKLNQTEFAAIAGATRQTQSNYEKGERMPDALYLAAIAAAGADVAYILTGTRVLPLAEQTPEEPREEELSQREKVLVAKWRMLPPAEQDDIEEIVEKIEQAQAIKGKYRKPDRKTG